MMRLKGTRCLHRHLTFHAQTNEIIKGETVLYLLVSTAAEKMLVVLPTQPVIKCILSSSLSVRQQCQQNRREKLFSFEQMDNKIKPHFCTPPGELAGAREEK